ncbi:hypothetical protein BDZ94DRAFT_1179885, partial [Collybia nuda]
MRTEILNHKLNSLSTTIEVSNACKIIEGYGPFEYNTPNRVDVVGPEYFKKNFKAKTIESQNQIINTITKYSLNTDQKRAFHIVANHATLPQYTPLKMYLGGMAGTGKSQVIKALVDFFNQRMESHRFMILAPTGTAAALLGGSTYHSILGIGGKGKNEEARNENTTIKQVQTKLKGVEYIFLDEVSMLSCKNLYSISARL